MILPIKWPVSPVKNNNNSINNNTNIIHIVGECSRIAKTEYKGRHDKLAKVIHWDLCKKCGVQVTSKWYEHVLEKVAETDQVKILWDFNIQML